MPPARTKPAVDFNTVPVDGAGWLREALAVVADPSLVVDLSDHFLDLD